MRGKSSQLIPRRGHGTINDKAAWMESLIAINETLRLPSPAPKPLGIAFDGPTLWMASRETNRIYAINAAAWTARDEGAAPGGPFGMTLLGDELRVIVGLGEKQNDRYIYRFVAGHGFKDDRIECPDLTGSHLAFDGDVLFLSQAHYRKILALDAQGKISSEILLDRTPMGMTIVDGQFYVVTTDEEFDNAQLQKVDARGSAPVTTTLASFPFDARGLAYDGSRFWTCHRDDNQIVAFTV
ncbi:MAG: hypothetical protein JO165_12275 [Candidatus Eremiobacteraeota bacterium]|nr:hypothetical protein [Candidatus Eremiobacteraeota bacterium]